MIKVVMFFKRREGLSAEEFRDYYETKHVKLFDGLRETAGVERYIRRYLTPIADPIAGIVRPSGFDVVMELWFSTREVFETHFKGTQDPKFRAIVEADEARLFDRSQIYANIVDEVDTDLQRPAP